MITLRDAIVILIAGQILPALGWVYLLGGGPGWLLAIGGQWLAFEVCTYFIDRARRKRWARAAYKDVQARMRQDGLIGRRRP